MKAIKGLVAGEEAEEMRGDGLAKSPSESTCHSGLDPESSFFSLDYRWRLPSA